MTTLFLTVLHMSTTASVAIAVVLLARLLLWKAPKKYAYLLWSVVGFRLLCPVSLRSAFSLFSLGSPASPAILPSPVPPGPPPPATVPPLPEIASQTPVISESIQVSQPTVSSGIDWLSAPALLWIIGIILLAGYSTVRELHLRRLLATATLLEDNVYCSEAVSSPFVLGVLRPRIYLPYGLTDEEQRYVLAHERCHLRRLDHITRRMAFLLLTLHWFNPLCHLAYALCGRDMELSCDEAVLRRSKISKQAYSAALLSFAAGHRMLAPAPLAFGETGIKSRITNALHWKQPKVWVSLLAAALSLAVLLVCGLDPQPPQEEDNTSQRFPFENILGFSGYYQDVYQSPSFLERTYYARTETGDFPIGYSFGGDDDHVADLDGDGKTELICNCIYNADGAQRVYLYTNRNGQILQGTLSPALLADYENLGANSIQERYDPDTRTFQLLYTKADNSMGKQQYTMEHFTFVPFVPEASEPDTDTSPLQSALQELQSRDDWTQLPISVQRVEMTPAGKPSVQPVTTPVTLLQQLSGQLLSAQPQEQGSGIHLQLIWEAEQHVLELRPSARLPGQVLLRYYGSNDSTGAPEDAVAQNEVLYLWLLALQNSAALEVHDLDNDGFQETLLFGKGGQLTVYDWYDRRPQVIDVNDLLGQQVSFTGLTANIGAAYQNTFTAPSPEGQMLFAYQDGTFTALSTFQEAQSRYEQ